MKRQNVRTLSLVVCTFTYLLIGAAVFDALESDTEAKRWKTLEEITRSVMRKYNITKDDFLLMETSIIENKPHRAGPQWKFAGAFYFATVVLAMIGYGHSTPATMGGKAFCMMYAMIGIPLGLVMFQSIGERLNKFASVVIRHVKTCLQCQKTEATEMNLMFATGLLSSVIITTGAAVFSQYEGWTYFDSFYYCFVTLTTIGFGDYVALQNDHALSQKPGYVALSLVFILFGLAVVAASINLLVLRFMTMNAEDIKREETEMSTVHDLMTLESEMMSTVNGKLLGSYPAMGNADALSYQDQASVCSCTCYGYSYGPSGYGYGGWRGSKKSNKSSSSTSSRRSPSSASGRRRRRICQLLPLDSLKGSASSMGAAVSAAAAATTTPSSHTTTLPLPSQQPRSRQPSDVYDNFCADHPLSVAKRASV